MKVTMKTDDPRIIALAKSEEIIVEDVDKSSYGDNFYRIGKRDYLVLTDDEADQQAGDYIRDSLWAFVPSFLLGYLPEGMDEETLQVIQERCESANPSLLAMVGDQIGELVDDAVGCDGRGHFLGTYDSDETEAGEFFIYRVN